ncbi:MAG: PspC domain-containing protein [Candidatus Saccharimonas sp.]|nr:PspC domain-containing protein [Candidatus Saccharimonas sp.]
MKEVTRISLAALPYNIEIDAKKELQNYLHAIEAALNADNDTMKEIEARVAELLAERDVAGEKVISNDDVRHIKEQLGDPKEFVGEPSDEQPASKPKRLMRSQGDEVLGGVCAGIAAYTNVDTVWVRLGMVLLAIATSGFMIPVYIVLWFVMPPANTAAERLQMKGKAVTLAALQQESDVIISKQKNDRIALMLIRIFGGTISILAACCVMIGLAGATWKVLSEPALETFLTQYWPQLTLIGLAGVIFVVFCLLLTRILFVGKSTKRLNMWLAVLTVLGFGTFTAGAVPLVLGLRADDTKAMNEYSKTAVQRKVDASVLTGAKSIIVDSPLPMRVNYGVYSDAPNATLWYNTKNSPLTPQVTLTRQGDEVRIALQASDKCLPSVMACRDWYTLSITGPALDSLSALSSNVIHYSTDSQQLLKTYTRADGQIELHSIGVIHQLDATLTNESKITTTEAAVTTINLTIEDALSNADIATVDTLAITVPTACASNHGGGTIRAQRAASVMVNSQAFDPDKDYPCTTIEIENF